MIYFNVILPTYYYDTGVKNILENMPLLDKNIIISIFDNTKNEKIYNVYLKYKKRNTLPNLYYYKSRPFKRPAVNWNYGIRVNDKLAKSSFKNYMIVLHQDEYLCKNFFSILTSIIKKNNYPDVINCSTIILKKIKILNKIHTTAQQRKFFYDFNFYYILKRNFIGPTSSMVIKFQNKHILFNTYYSWLIDVEYYIKIFLNYKKWVFTDEIFVYSDQLNKNSLTSKLKSKIYTLNKLETKLINKKYNINNNLSFLNIFDIFVWVSIRIYNKIKISFNYKKFFH